MDISGNKATAYGLIAAAEKAGLRLFLGSYPITPATDILHELSKHKSLGLVCRCVGGYFYFGAGCLSEIRGYESGCYYRITIGGY